MIWDWLAHYVSYKHIEENVIQSLKNIEIEMVKTDINIRRSKTVGNALTIVGAIAAPFTFGTSLIATGVGIAINVGSTLGESALLSFYMEKATEECKKYTDICEKLQSWDIDWLYICETLGKAAINAVLLETIRRMIPKMTLKMFECIPRVTILRILSNFQIKIKQFALTMTNTSINFSFAALKTSARQISNEIGESAAKLVSKKFLIAVISISVIIDIADIIYIWRKDRPDAIKKLQAAIKELENNQ